MPYNELIKNFDRIRDYMREFYVYGFKSREEYDKKSARSYDDERRRIESWLGDYMGFRRSQDGKNVFISLDSRAVRHNPLYKAWKAKSFTAGDITLHFLLFDILAEPGGAYTLQEIMEGLDAALSGFCEPRMFDASTVRKKLKEYEEKGLICTVKQGKTILYQRAGMTEPVCSDVLDFFSEAAPCGVIGSFLLDRADAPGGHFAFKHHYITQALDSDILCAVFDAIRQKRTAAVEIVSRRTGRHITENIVPLRVFVSVQSGRQYVMAYCPRRGRIRSFRLDTLWRVNAGENCPEFDRLRETLDRMQDHMWGVSTQGESGGRAERVEFTVCFEAGEEYIHR
ncbi:MAG: WYL domain-containing protein, partial [Lachnospiraceae bacterium]|nr:WYL domain-containing protein [Lachnospiraceae bacterium]